MTRLLAFVFAAVIFLLGAVLIGPSFVDWNQYKPRIVEEVKTATGYDVTIGGDINLALLPSPSIKIRDVSVAAPKKMKSDTLARIEQANVSVALIPLLSKKIEVDTVSFVKPDIRLEILPNGTKGWMTDQMAQQEAPQDGSGGSATPPAKQKSPGQAVTFDEITIKGGRFEYADYQAEKQYLLEDINVSLGADSLTGPFDGKGDFVYGGRKVVFDGETGRTKDGEMPVTAALQLPDINASAGFAGVMAMGGPLDIQGETELKADRLGDIMALTGGSVAPALDQKLSVQGLLTATEDNIALTDMAFGFGDLSGQGTFALQNMKTRKPVIFKGDIDLKGVLDLDRVAAAIPQDKTTPADKVLANAGKEKQPSATASPGGGFIPRSLTLPFQTDGALTLNVEEVRFKGKPVKGFIVDAKKDGSTVRFDAKALEIPGSGKFDGNGTLSFASASVSPQSGAVTYADPALSFTVTGGASNMPELMRVAGQEGPVADLWKTVQFNLHGDVLPDKVSIKDSTVKLDQMTAVASLSYQPAGNGGKPNAALAVSADTIDIDAIKARLNGEKKPLPAAAGQGAEAPSVKEAVAPLRDFSLPVNLTFDLAAQQARLNGMNISDLRLAGSGTGKALSLNVATAKNLMGADVNARGRIDDLEKLSGIDVDLQANADNANAFLKSLNVDTTKLPDNIGAANATISLKGDVDKLGFTSNIRALSGQLDATGYLTDVMGKPSVGDLTMGIKHPNFVKAMQIMNPSFSGGAGLAKPFDFYTKMVSAGKVYSLSDMKANFGPTSVAGNLKVDMSAARPSVAGAIQMGTLPLDSFLGAKTAAASSGGGGGSDAGGVSGGDAGSGSRWSRNAIETGWMRSTDLDLDINARAITYGGWNFEQPSTKVTLKDGALTVKDLNAGLFGGKAVLNSKVQAPADPKQPIGLTVQSAMTDVAMEPLVYALSGSRRLQAQGTVSLDMDLASTGISSNALINALKGKANLNGQNVILKGFDLPRLARSLSEEEKIGDSVQNVLGSGFSGGQTQFDTVKGVYDVNEGIVAISSMVMDGPSAVINSTGNANLPRWTIDTVHEISLKGVDDLQPFKVSIKGSLSNPGNTFGKGILEDYINRKIQRKIGKEIPKLLGDDVGSKLQQLGILPKTPAPAAPAVPAQQAAPATESVPEAGEQPAAGDDSWNNPQESGAAPQPPAEAAPQQQQQPQQEITPEDAIRGVLDGLLQQ